MAYLEEFLPMDRRYCSATPALRKFWCPSVVPAVIPCCRSSSVVHPAWITEPLTPQRCQWISHCLCSPGPAWKRLSSLGKSVSLGSNVPVLVRGDRDGFYYRGTIKEETENERGMFLVEFAKPLVSRGKHPVCVQKTSKDDILEYVNGMKHSLLPGDKVLAPWEPEMARYGPGSVLMGIETRDPSRAASEDEDITVQFWNGKKVKLPRGVALWIPPSLWEKIVEMIHMPFTSRVKTRESLDTKPCIFSCSLTPAPIPVWAVHRLAKHCLLCSPCCPHFHCHCDGTSCSLAYKRWNCCYHPHVDTWWPLPSRSVALQSETEETGSISKPSPCLLELKDPNQEAVAAVAASPPYSDSDLDLQPFSTKSSVVESAVDTGSGCLEKPRLKGSARPSWKYWKRSHHKSHPSNSGLASCSSTCKMESTAISTGDMSGVAPTNQSALFETFEQSPRGQLSVEETTRHQDLKLSLREEASEKQRYKTEKKETESDDKCSATCIGDSKLDDTDHVRRGQTEKTVLICSKTERCDQPEFNKHTTDKVQELEFQELCNQGVSLMRLLMFKAYGPGQKLQCAGNSRQLRVPNCLLKKAADCCSA